MSGRLFLLIGKTSVNDFFFDVFINQVTSLLTVTYVKLQSAYFAETTKLGGWTLIGYKAPGTATSATNSKSNNFEYDGSAIDANTAVVTATTDSWKAKNNNKLNDCGSAFHWHIKSVWSDNNVTYEPTIDGETAGECTALTASFTQIGG